MKAIILQKFEQVRETEKAVLISTPMIVGKKGVQQKEFWMPKSAIKMVEQGLAVATWIAAKCESIQYQTYFNSVVRENEATIVNIEI